MAEIRSSRIALNFSTVFRERFEEKTSLILKFRMKLRKRIILRHSIEEVGIAIVSLLNIILYTLPCI